MVHMRRGGVDMKMGGVMIAGGLMGSFVGAALFRFPPINRRIDVAIGPDVRRHPRLRSATDAQGFADDFGRHSHQAATKPQRHNRWVASLPLRWRFYSSGIYISPVAPLALGFLAAF